jgi:hypothetical protein
MIIQLPSPSSHEMKLHYSGMYRKGCENAALLESDTLTQLNPASSTTEKLYYMNVVKVLGACQSRCVFRVGVLKSNGRLNNDVPLL